MTYQEWLRETSQAMQPRGRVLKSLDYVLGSYIRSPNPATLQHLRLWLDEWKREQGPGDAWMHSKRNASSGAFIRLHKDLGGSDNDAVFGTQSFMAADLINARLGLLYLFGNLRCDDRYFKIATTGVLDLTIAAINFPASSTNNEKLYGSGAALSLAKPELAAGAARLDKRFNRADVAPPPVDSHTRRVADTLRAGGMEVELFGGAERGRLDLREQQRTVSSTQLLESRAYPPLDPAGREYSRRIAEQLQAAGMEVELYLEQASTREVASEAPTQLSTASKVADKAWAIAPAKLRPVCDLLANTFYAHSTALGYGIGVLSSVVASIEAGTARFKEWRHGQGVQVLQGHPSTIVQAIRGAMNQRVAGSLYQLLKNSALLGLQIATTGVALLAALIASLLETLIGIVWRLFDIRRMQSFFKQAHEYWLSRDQAWALHTQPMMFNNWFKRYAVTTPTISVLALNSGICGSKMNFLKMFSSSNRVINQSTYDAGVRYIDELKGWGSQYLEDVGYAFSSDDALVSALIRPGYRPPEGFIKKRLWRSFKAFING
jgi:hypothetical protein